MVRGETSIPIAESLHYAEAMACAALLMAFCWSFLRLPEGNVLMTAFCFLSVSSLYQIPDGRARFSRLLPMAFSAAFLQFLVGVCREEKLLLILLPALCSTVILRNLPGKGTACSMCIIGYLAFFSPGGWMPAWDRACGIAVGIPVVLLVTAIFHSHLPEKKEVHACFSLKESLLLGLLLGIGTWLSEALRMGQGAWIMLTILFICQFSCISGCYAGASLDRIIATPLGLLLGGLYLGCLAFFDYRFIYLLFPFGAFGFYLLKRDRDFFLFTVFFMMTFSIYADWATGSVHRFHYAELLVQRSTATLIGAVFMILYEGMMKGEGKT